MVHASELVRATTVRLLPRSRRRLIGTGRMAAVLFLMLWLGPVTMAQTDFWQILEWAGAPAPATATSSIVAAGDAVVLAPGVPMRLSLRDGSVVSGRFLGRTLLDSALYRPRFLARSEASSWVPFALGETLLVALRDGRAITEAFTGYGELSLLLANLSGGADLRIPFEFADSIRRADGSHVAPKDLMRAFRKGALPSREALALGASAPLVSEADEWTSALRVAVEDIRSATALTPSGGSVAGVVVLTVLLGIVIFCLMVASSRHSSSTSCASADYPGFLSGMSVRLTDRPFDRSRGCYEGDPPLAAEEWPGGDEAHPAVAGDAADLSRAATSP